MKMGGVVDIAANIYPEQLELSIYKMGAIVIGNNATVSIIIHSCSPN